MALGCELGGVGFAVSLAVCGKPVGVEAVSFFEHGVTSSDTALDLWPLAWVA
jgi:hypothetical protein